MRILVSEEPLFQAKYIGVGQYIGFENTLLLVLNGLISVLFWLGSLSVKNIAQLGSRIKFISEPYVSVLYTYNQCIINTIYLYPRHKYDTLIETLKKYINTKQETSKSLQQYQFRLHRRIPRQPMFQITTLILVGVPQLLLYLTSQLLYLTSQLLYQKSQLSGVTCALQCIPNKG